MLNKIINDLYKPEKEVAIKEYEQKTKTYEIFIETLLSLGFKIEGVEEYGQIIDYYVLKLEVNFTDYFIKVKNNSFEIVVYKENDFISLGSFFVDYKKPLDINDIAVKIKDIIDGKTKKTYYRTEIERHKYMYELNKHLVNKIY